MEIKLSARIYPLEAILNACYLFIDCVYIFLDSDLKGNQIKVFFKGKGKFSGKKLEALKGEFKNELLRCALRYEISKSNKKIREYIVGRALYTTLPGPGVVSLSEKLDYQDDPLGIALPWKKKHRKQKNARKRKI